MLQKDEKEQSQIWVKDMQVPNKLKKEFCEFDKLSDDAQINLETKLKALKGTFKTKKSTMQLMKEIDDGWD
ncbi:hypothetical protein HY988_01560 [Candidatus Micrarchaeota archaeon]|nr:hypothetical protein [Candidatus Micrarchaeota archaeon]